MEPEKFQLRGQRKRGMRTNLGAFPFRGSLKGDLRASSGIVAGIAPFLSPLRIKEEGGRRRMALEAKIAELTDVCRRTPAIPFVCSFAFLEGAHANEKAHTRILVRLLYKSGVTK